LENDGIISTERKCEIWGLIMVALTGFLLLSLLTDGFQADPESGRPIDGMLSVPNMLGPPGAFVAGILAFLIGDASHVLYGITIIWALKLLIHRPVGRPFTRIAGLVLLTGALAGTLHICMDQGFTNTDPGGAFGAFVAENFLVRNFGIIGSSIIALMAALIGTLLATDFFLIQLLLYVQRSILWMLRGVWFVLHGVWRIIRWLVGSGEQEEQSVTTTQTEPAATTVPVFAVAGAALAVEPVPEEPRIGWAARMVAALKPTIRHGNEQDTEMPEGEEELSSTAPNIVVVGDTFKEVLPQERVQVHKPVSIETETPDPFGGIPDPDEGGHAVTDVVAAQRSPENELFGISDDRDEWTNDSKDTDNGQEEPLKVETVLAGVVKKEEPPAPEARVTDVTRGPTITRFELEPAPGMKVSRFLSLTDDIALALKAKGVRVEAPIPGKGRVGIEVSNAERDPVVSANCWSIPVSQQAKQAESGAGQGYRGRCVIADLMRMPHLLVAGATGAGKTVCVKALLASLLFQHTPDDCS
jgi:hypothetical protein